MICLCVFIYDFIYEFIYGIICRYIWAYREQLCRSVHDMSKQRYATKKYGVKAWQALAEWIYQCGDDDESNRRQSLLITFGKDDTDFWDVVAACLWTLATAANLPWGRSAIQPSVYSAVPDYEKVFFFLVVDHSNHIWTNLCFICVSVFICDTGLGFLLWGPPYSEQSPGDVVEGFPSRRVGSPPETTPPFPKI